MIKPDEQTAAYKHIVKDPIIDQLLHNPFSNFVSSNNFNKPSVVEEVRFSNERLGSIDRLSWKASFFAEAVIRLAMEFQQTTSNGGSLFDISIQELPSHTWTPQENQLFLNLSQEFGEKMNDSEFLQSFFENYNIGKNTLNFNPVIINGQQQYSEDAAGMLAALCNIGIFRDNATEVIIGDLSKDDLLIPQMLPYLGNELTGHQFMKEKYLPSCKDTHHKTMYVDVHSIIDPEKQRQLQAIKGYPAALLAVHLYEQALTKYESPETDKLFAPENK